MYYYLSWFWVVWSSLEVPHLVAVKPQLGLASFEGVFAHVSCAQAGKARCAWAAMFKQPLHMAGLHKASSRHGVLKTVRSLTWWLDSQECIQSLNRSFARLRIWKWNSCHFHHILLVKSKPQASLDSIRLHLWMGMSFTGRERKNWRAPS